MKLKTVKSAQKRIANITKRGKLIRRKLSAQHLVSGKTKRTRQNSAKKQVVAKADSKKIKRLLPYS